MNLCRGSKTQRAVEFHNSVVTLVRTHNEVEGKDDYYQPSTPREAVYRDMRRNGFRVVDGLAYGADFAAYKSRLPFFVFLGYLGTLLP